MITALGPRLGLGLRLDFGSQVWFVQYFSEKRSLSSMPALHHSSIRSHPDVKRPKFGFRDQNLVFQFPPRGGLYTRRPKFGLLALYHPGATVLLGYVK
jgi:hypothetical protein